MTGRFAIAISLIIVLGGPVTAQEKPKKAPARLTAERIYQAREFEAEGASVKWLDDGKGYTTWEDSNETTGGKDLVRHDPASGKDEILVPAAHLVPPREGSSLRVEGYTLTKDLSRLLIFTNTQRVWRQNTRGDYWVLDRATRELRKLDGKAPAASLMFAKLAPVGHLVG